MQEGLQQAADAVNNLLAEAQARRRRSRRQDDSTRHRRGSADRTPAPAAERAQDHDGPAVHVAVDPRVPRVHPVPDGRDFYFSFTRYDLLSRPEPYGIQNHVYMFTKDPNFWVAVRNTIWILATLMLPFQVTVIPLYVIFVRLGWINTLAPLIVPSFFGDAFSIFLLRQFFLTIPDEMSDAARVDGASEWQIMTRVIVPLAKPAIAAVALFNFLYNWNDFFGPLLYVVGNSKLWTLGLALSEFRTMHHVEWNLTMAASMLFMLPVIVIFFLAQRVFVEGVTLTGVKG
jgi:ABC-type sugar transport system permease subunit